MTRRKPGIASTKGMIPAALGAALAGGLPLAADAGVVLDDQGKVTVFGDVRFRAEADDRTRADGTDQDRERLRLRARIGARYKPNARWSGEIRLATGGNGNSPYITLDASEDNGR